MDRLVIVESPYAGDVEGNVAYARACLADCLRRGEAPLASHLLYPQVLDDLLPAERAKGIAAGLAWAQRADAGIFYIDRGISKGMEAAAAFYADRRMHTEIRRLGTQWS